MFQAVAGLLALGQGAGMSREMRQRHFSSKLGLSSIRAGKEPQAHHVLVGQLEGHRVKRILAEGPQFRRESICLSR